MSEPACAGCAALSNPDYPRVTLEDGREATTWCECWRVECFNRDQEARMVLRFASRDVRLEHLAKVEAERGKLARDRLAAEVLRQWEARRERRATAKAAE